MTWWTLEMLTIAPPWPWSRKRVMASRAHMNEPRRLMSMTLSNAPLSSSCEGREIWMPALLTRTSIEPRPSTVSSTIRTTSAPLETSPWTSRSCTPCCWTLLMQVCTCSSVPAAALADRAGSIDWLCLPPYDSPAVFSRLLDPAAGHWSITPTTAFEVERRYAPASLVIETTFRTDTGVVRLTDALAFQPGQRGHDLGKDAPHELLRLVEGVEGEVELRYELAPRPEYGLVKPLFRMEDLGGRTFGGPNRIAVRVGVRMELDDDATMAATFRVAAGEQVGFSLRWAAPDDPAPVACPPDEVASRLQDTVDAWRSWEGEHDIYEGPRRELVKLSARVLKGLTYRPTGAIVAAPTAGLPETEGGERNWDYRYAWVRDASLTVQALYIGTCTDEAGDFVSFMTSSAGGRVDEHLQIMYGIDGRHDL